MKRVLFTLAAVLLLFTNAQSAPLVFQTSKQVEGAEFVELANFDASKYRQIRIGITDDKAFESILNIFAVENNQEMLMEQIKGTFLRHTILIDSPPSRISFRVRGEGTYHLFIWAKE